MESRKPNPFKDDMSGRLMLGKYRIVRKLAAGGMGIVYLARTEGAAGFAKPVVLKLILPDFASNDEFVTMFVREAKILASIEDPGIVTVLDFSKEDGFYIMVLEYVHGFQLREWIRYFRANELEIPANLLLQVFVNVLDSLHHAHTCRGPDGALMQIIHRDISPTNILISVDGKTKLLDFGIAQMSASSGKAELTMSGFKGKYAYSAPERFADVPASVRSDVYSVGVALHESLIGRNEFLAENDAAIITRVMNHTPSYVEAAREDAPPGIDMVLRKALAKNPDERFDSAASFARALRQMLPESEHESAMKLTAFTRDHFTDEMADFLGVERLSSRINAWRNPSTVPPPPAVFEEETVVTRPGATKIPPEGFREQLTPTGHSAKTRVVASTKAAGEAGASPSDIIESNRKSSATFSLPLILAALALAIALVAALGFFMMRKPAPTQQGKFLLIQSALDEDTDSADSSKPPPQPDASTQPPTVSTAQPDSASLTTDTEKPVAITGSAKKLTREQEQLNDLTSAFRRNKTQVRGCFKQHEDAGAGINEISIQFTINASGTVTNSVTSPASINGTALGSCITAVARKTQFPSQRSGLTFSIPVSIRK